MTVKDSEYCHNYNYAEYFPTATLVYKTCARCDSSKGLGLKSFGVVYRNCPEYNRVDN
jgi:hypothetical protein